MPHGAKKRSINSQGVLIGTRKGAFGSSSEGLLGHDVIEVIHRHNLVVVGVSSLDHLLQFLVGHGLAELAGHAAEVLEGDSVGAIVVEQLEHLVDVLTGILVAHAGRHHVQELLEVNVARFVLVQVGDHLVDGLVLGLEAQALHGRAELLGVDGAGTVSVEKVEGFLDLLNLVLGEAGPQVLIG